MLLADVFEKFKNNSWENYGLCSSHCLSAPTLICQANNKYFKSSDQKQESKHIVYLDANNLYHNTMSKIFPTGEFKWIDPKSFDNINMYS